MACQTLPWPSHTKLFTFVFWSFCIGCEFSLQILSFLLLPFLYLFLYSISDSCLLEDLWFWSMGHYSWLSCAVTSSRRANIAYFLLVIYTSFIHNALKWSLCPKRNINSIETEHVPFKLDPNARNDRQCDSKWLICHVMVIQILYTVHICLMRTIRQCLIPFFHNLWP